MHIQEQSIEGGVVWHLRGQLTEGCGEMLERAVHRAACDGWRRVVVDLEAVSLVDAGGLGSLITAYRTCTKNLMALSLACVPKRVLQLLTVTQLTTVLQIFDSVEQAIRFESSSACSASPMPAPRLFQESVEVSP